MEKPVPFTLSSLSYRFELSNRPLGGFGFMAWCVWCAIARIVRYDNATFSDWCQTIGVKPLAPAVRSFHRPSSPLQAMNNAAQTVWNEHVYYMTYVLSLSDARSDTPFQDLYRLARSCKTRMENHIDVFLNIARIMVVQTFLNPRYYVVRDQNGSCAVWTRERVPDNVSMELPMYPFVGFEDVEDYRSLQETSRDKDMARVYCYEGTEDKRVELYKFNVEYRSVESRFLSEHALWSWEDVSVNKKTNQQRTVMCGGMSQFVNHHCNPNNVMMVKPKSKWVLTFDSKKKFPDKTMQVFLSYTVDGSRERLVNILHGPCHCDQCKPSNAYGLDVKRTQALLTKRPPDIAMTIALS